MVYAAGVDVGRLIFVGVDPGVVDREPWRWRVDDERRLGEHLRGDNDHVDRLGVAGSVDGSRNDRLVVPARRVCGSTAGERHGATGIASARYAADAKGS